MDAPSTARRRAQLLAGCAVWAMAVPWLARGLGLRLDVPARLEVIDHVVPGLAVLLCCAALAGAAERELVRLGLLAVAGLAGLWITAAHVTLVGEALDGITGWGPALLHLAAGPPIVVVAVWMIARDPGSDRRRATERCGR